MKVTVLSDASAPSLVLALLPAFAAAAGIPAEDERRLGAVVERLVSFTLDNAYPDDDLGEIEVTLEAGDGSRPGRRARLGPAADERRRRLRAAARSRSPLSLLTPATCCS